MTSMFSRRTRLEIHPADAPAPERERAWPEVRANRRPGLRSIGVFGMLLAMAVPSLAAPPVGTAIPNTASAAFANGGLASSNTVTAIVQAPPPPPVMSFYTSGTFATTTRTAALGQPLYLQALAPGCDFDALSADTVLLTVRSRLTGDQEVFRAGETAPGSATFRVLPPIPTTAGGSVSGDGVIATTRGDEIIASLNGCGAGVTEARVWVDPVGLVFDARSGLAIPGAQVSLIDVSGQGNGGAAGGPATVWQDDGVTPAPNTVTSDLLGHFQFPRVAASDYRLVVLPPAPYAFPVTIPPASLPAGFLVDAAGSYGAPFAVTTPDAPVTIDLPVDAGAQVTLFAEKTASRPQVEIGEALEYAVRVANRSDSAFAAAFVRDQLPPGFAYVPGTIRRDGNALADPAGTGPEVDFAIGALAPGEVTQVTYTVRVGAGAVFGDAFNHAVARAGPFQSNDAVARVRVEEGLFAQSATVVGTVSMTTRITPGMPAMPAAEGGVTPEASGVTVTPPTGVAGVRVWLDDGTFAITDASGRFSFTGVTPRTHALKVDPTTLPKGAKLLARDHRDSRQPGLRFVDVVRGDFQRAEFHLEGDSVAVKEVGERLLAAAGRRDDLTRALARGTAPLVAPPANGDPRALPAQGIVTGEAGLPLAPRSIVPASAGAQAAWASNARSAASEPLEELVRTLDDELGFIGLADLDTVVAPQAAIRVKGPIGTVLSLRVNGERISESRVGMRVTNAENGVEAWEYVGIALKPGSNRIEVAPPKSIGRVALRLVAPGPLARLELTAGDRAPADGRSVVPLRIRTLDAEGIPNGARTLVTIESSAGVLQGTDLNPAEAGLQVAIEGGEAVIPLVAPGIAGEAKVRVTAGTHHADASVRFVPDLSPLLAVGTVEGVVGLGRTGSFGRGGDFEASSFEATIDQFASARRDGRAMAAAHGAVFARGRVREDLALTLGYDSDRPRDLRFQRDLQPESGPPLIGDGATRGYEAQSTGRLYARLDRGVSSVMYGDFITRGTSSPRSLAAYQRSLTGARTEWTQGGVTLNAFTSRDRSGQRVEELRGLGISGPYTLGGAPIVDNTEQIEVLVRDRNQPSVILSRSVRQRFVDYEVEPLTGRITFRAPVPALDADLNPISIRVTYESETGGDAFWVSGMETRVALGNRSEVTGTYVDDHEAGNARELRGVGFLTRLGDHSKLETEFATTRRLGEAIGMGSRFELSHENTTANGRLWLAATGSRFDNPGAGVAAGRTEGGGRLVAKLNDRTRFSSEALWSADASGRDRRAGILASFDRALTPALRGELGMRVAGQTREGSEAPPASASLRSRLNLQLPARPQWSGYMELEQDVREFDRRMFAIGGENRFHSRGRLYARHEIISSAQGPFAFNAAERQLTTVAGVDADLVQDAHLYSEYRLGDAFAGREAQAAVGLRNGWKLPQGVRLGTSFERVSALRGSSTGPSTAVTASIEQIEGGDWRGSSRFEVRSSRAADSYLQTLAAAVRLDSTWTALFRHHFDLTHTHPGTGGARMRFQVGTAWRPGGAWDALGRLEFRYDRAGIGPDGRNALDSGLFAPGSRRRLAQILSLQTTGRLDEHFQTSVAWAGKRTHDEAIVGVTRGSAQWTRGRLTLDMAHGWDAGLQSSVLFGDRLADRRYGIGAELGRQMSPGVWLSAGYNHFGYRDDELTGADWTRAGVYLRLRAKFDERLFGVRLDSAEDAPVAPASAPAAPPMPGSYTGGDPR